MSVPSRGRFMPCVEELAYCTKYGDFQYKSNELWSETDEASYWYYLRATYTILISENYLVEIRT